MRFHLLAHRFVCIVGQDPVVASIIPGAVSAVVWFVEEVTGLYWTEPNSACDELLITKLIISARRPAPLAENVSFSEINRPLVRMPTRPTRLGLACHSKK